MQAGGPWGVRVWVWGCVGLALSRVWAFMSFQESDVSSVGLGAQGWDQLGLPLIWVAPGLPLILGCILGEAAGLLGSNPGSMQALHQAFCISP